MLLPSPKPQTDTANRNTKTKIKRKGNKRPNRAAWDSHCGTLPVIWISSSAIPILSCNRQNPGSTKKDMGVNKPCGRITFKINHWEWPVLQWLSRRPTKQVVLTSETDRTRLEVIPPINTYIMSNLFIPERKVIK